MNFVEAIDSRKRKQFGQIFQKSRIRGRVNEYTEGKRKENVK